MNRKAGVLAGVLLSSGLFTVIGQTQTATPAGFGAQADAGRAAYENSCGRCHTYSLHGRKGDAGEVPPMTSLAAPYLKFIGTPVNVPALTGRDFVDKYGEKTVAEMFTLFRGAADSTPVSELHMSDDTLVDITAYILRTNGARPGDQPFTKITGTVFQSIVK